MKAQPTSSVVLDASALLAVLNQEAGAELAAKHLPGALISSANWAEVVGKLAEAGMPPVEIDIALESIGLEIVPLTAEVARSAGLLRPKTRKLGLSLADRICIALAEALNLPAMTTDAAWKKAKLSCKVMLIR